MKVIEYCAYSSVVSFTATQRAAAFFQGEQEIPKQRQTDAPSRSWEYYLGYTIRLTDQDISCDPLHLPH